MNVTRVMTKAVVYAALAAFITVAYVAALLGLQAVLVRSGKSNLALAVLAAALVAVVFQPVRVRIERLASRLAYGQRLVPYEALAALSRRMREPIAADALLPAMARTVAEGTGAIRAVVWLASGGQMKPVAAWPDHHRDDESRLLGTEAVRTVSIHDDGELLGALTVTKPAYEPMSPAEDKLLVDLAAQAGLAMRNARLVLDLKASRQRIVAAQDAERRRLERDIHDGAQQRLITLSLALRLAGTRPEITPDAAARLDTAVAEIKLCLAELRELARGVHPVLLTEEGLGPALAALAQRSPIRVKILSTPDRRLPAAIEDTAYQVVRQALAAAAAAHATSVAVSARLDRGELVVEAADDAAATDRMSPGLADRVAALDGRIRIEASPGGGAVMKAMIPCESC